MTTNAIDRVKKILASDSRWSIEDGDFILYVDDTGLTRSPTGRSAASFVPVTVY